MNWVSGNDMLPMPLLQLSAPGPGWQPSVPKVSAVLLQG